MKTMRKIFAVILVLSMLMGMTVTAMAEEGTGSVTIKNTVSNVTYEFHKMLEVETVTTGSGGSATTIYYYKPTTDWVEFFSGTNGGVLFGTVNANGYIAWTNQTLFASETDPVAAGNAAAALAVEAKKYIEAKGLNGIKTAKSEGMTLTVDKLEEDAYYLVESSIGSTVMAGPVMGSTTLEINEKNGTSGAPGIVKTVGPNDESYMSVDVGVPFDYKVVITINEEVDAGSMKVFDTVPENIKMTDGSLNVVLNRGGTNSTLVRGDAGDYTVTNATIGSTKNYTFAFKDNFTTGDTLTLTYEATLVSANGVAPVVHELYPNSAKVEYGSRSISDTASVFTLALNGWKYYLNDTNAEIGLKDAQFVLKNEEGKYYKIVDTDDDSEKVEYVVSWVSDINEATVVTSIEGDGVKTATGDFTFYGIAMGEYTLVETMAPDGYVGAADTEVTVDRTLKKAEVENVKGAGGMLPSTGGMGTTALYLAGVALVLGAGVMMFARKKRTEEE